MGIARSLPLVAIAGVLACRAPSPRADDAGVAAIASAALEPLDADRAAPDARARPERIDKWSLWTGGTHLRGANVWQKRIDRRRDGDAFGSGAVGPPYTRGELDELARLGANYVNVSHPGLFTERPPYAVDPAVVASLDALLAAIEAADMFAVIAFRTGPGRSEASFGASPAPARVWSDRDAQAAWVAMWTFTARRYRGRAVVAAYDLMVEPDGERAIPGAADPARFYPAHRGSLADWNPLAARLVAAIVAEDDATPCIIEPMGFASVAWLAALEAPNDPRALFAVHPYDPHVYTHPSPGRGGGGRDLAYPGTFDADGDGAADEVGRAWLHAHLARASATSAKVGRPLAANEFGVTRWARGGAEYLGDVLDELEAAGMNHAVWLWESRAPKIQYDTFNVRRGEDRLRHAEVAAPSNALVAALARVWARNTVRPSHGAAPR